MVKKSLLTDRQREEIKKYLVEMPSAMPPYIRSLRGYCKGVSFKEMRKDLELMEKLSKLKVKMGRKTLASQDQRANFIVRRPSSHDTKAVFKTRQRNSNETKAVFRTRE